MDEDGYKRDPRNSELAEINQQINGQNERIKNITKVAEQTNNTTNQVATQLGRHREIITNNIDLNQQIKYNAKLADKKASQMIRRNLCIKFVLWLVIIALFAANIGLVIWKLKRNKPASS